MEETTIVSNATGLSEGSASAGAPAELPPEEALRAGVYGLLSTFLSAPPTSDVLASGAELVGDDTPFGTAVTAFARVCRGTTVDAADTEYHALFIGLSRGELLPYASYYLTGFLHEKPLARLRNDMAELGLERQPDVSEPEDHIASVCEIMASLINGSLDAPASLEAQRKFFETHLNSWAPHFFKDLEAARASVLYAALGSVGRRFLEVEARGFELAVAESGETAR